MLRGSVRDAGGLGGLGGVGGGTGGVSELPRPRTVIFSTREGRCLECGSRVLGQHGSGLEGVQRAIWRHEGKCLAVTVRGPVAICRPCGRVVRKRNVREAERFRDLHHGLHAAGESGPVED